MWQLLRVPYLWMRIIGNEEECLSVGGSCVEMGEDVEILAHCKAVINGSCA